MGTVMIELPVNEAEAFKLFRKYQDQFAVMVENRVFEVRKGQVILNFSPQGTITEINVHMNVFSGDRNRGVKT